MALGATLPGRVLVVEDSASDRHLIQELLAEIVGAPERIEGVGTLAAARSALTRSSVDCVLLDLSLPDCSGLEGVAVMASAAPNIPIVVVTGRPADAVVYAALAEGADEFLCKADLTSARLHDTLLRACERRRGGDRSRAPASVALDAFDAPTVALDGTGRVTGVNQAWQDAGTARGAPPATTGIGVNYLTVCDQAATSQVSGAREAADGIRSVLCGEVDRFSIDYPCEDAASVRWFSLRARPLGEIGGGAVVTHLDITSIKEAEDVLHRDSARLHSLFDESSPVFALLDAHGVIRHVSESTTALFGLERNQVVGEDALRRIDPADRPLALEVFARVMAVPGAREQVRIQVLDRDRRRREIEVVAVNLLDDPSVEAVLVTGSDVTEGRHQQIARRLEAGLLQRLPAAVVVTDDRGIVVYWNDRASTVFGHSAEEAVGRPVADLYVRPTAAEQVEAVQESLASTGRWEGDYTARRSDGSPIPVHTTLELVDDPEIGFHGVVGASLDITERQHLEESLAFQALHDPLTGLPNRRLFVDHLDNALSRSVRNRSLVAVLFIDLDDFKAVNDRLGHVGGDQVLCFVGETLTSVLRDGDVVARLGGDEFVICCEDLRDPAAAYAVADKVLESLSEPVTVDGTVVAVTGSVGIAISQAGSAGETLLRNADAAMYSAKTSGKSTVDLFDDARHSEVRARHQVAVALEAAIRAGHVHAAFQPQVDLQTGELTGFEALARWSDPDGGQIPPDQFIPVAEQNGLIAQLGSLILADACEALRRWNAVDPQRDLTVSVNVSPRQLSDPAFPDTVRHLIHDAGIDPARVCLEVTESGLMEIGAATEVLHRLKHVGVQIAIDDFGTGYSSLSRLRGFPVDHLKIDRSFVTGLMKRSEDSIIISSVIGLAHSLGLRVIAEGIEYPEQLELLLAQGCEQGQGFLWGGALTTQEATRIVADSGPTARQARPPQLHR